MNTNVLKDLHFRKVGKAKPDSKNRVALGRLPIKADHFEIFLNDTGQILLIPHISIPTDEVWLFQNKKARASLLQGWQEAREGKLLDSPEDFSKYVQGK